TMFGMVRRVGRLVEFWIESPVSEKDAEDVGNELRRLIAGDKQKIVLAADATLMRTLPPAVATRFINIMRSDNPLVERSGFLVSDQAATFALQLERMIKEANSPVRKVFRHPGEWETWLAEVLSPNETRRLRHFVSERATAILAARG